jgi:hypothetical protein
MNLENYTTPTPQALQDLIHSNPRQAVKCPDLAGNVWVNLAATYPLEALQNPSLPMYALQEPSWAWARLEAVQSEAWIFKFLHKGYKDYQQVWAAECLERVLPFYTEHCPTEGSIPLVVQLRKACSSEHLQSLTASYLLGLEMARKTSADLGKRVIEYQGSRNDTERTTLLALHTYSLACISHLPELVARHCARAVARYDPGDESPSPMRDLAQAERVAQWRLLLPYLLKHEGGSL